MKRESFVKKARGRLNSLLALAKAHRLVTALSVALVVTATAAALFAFASQNQKDLAIQKTSEANEAPLTEEKLLEQLEATIPQEYTGTGSQKTSSAGRCGRPNGKDADGNYYVEIRIQDGSYKCVKYSMADGTDVPIDGTESSMTTQNGRQAVKKQIFTDAETGATTTYIQYADGSSYYSTDGGYWPLYFDDYQANKRFYIMTNGMEMTQRFMFCMTNGYTTPDGRPGTRLLTPEEQAERASQPYPYAGPDCNAGNMPQVFE